MALNRIQTDGIEDDAITTAKILDGTVGPADIEDGALTNTQINASAAIAVAKISGLGTAAALTAGTSANNVVQLDGSARLPAVNASLLTNLDATDLTGVLPAISGAALTGVATDTSAMENNIAILAFKTQSANNLAKFNLVDQVIDEYKDDTGLGTQTNVDRSGSTAADGYISSLTSTGYGGAVADTCGNTTKTITAVNGATSTSSAPANNGANSSGAVVGSGSALFFGTGNNSGAYFRITDHTDFDFGTGDVTFECWAHRTNASGNYDILYHTSNADGHGMAYLWAANGTVEHQFGTGSWSNTGWISNAGTTGTWHHFAMSRSSGTAKVFIDGTQIFSGTRSGNYDGNQDFKIGAWNYGSLGDTMNGYIMNMRVNKSAIYTSNFTPPTSITPDSNTILLVTGYEEQFGVSATGTLISTANTALTAPTTGDVVLLIEEVDAVTATLNTAGNDLRCAISRNGGASAGDWDYVTLANKGSWGTNKKILVANDVAFSNSASGTDMRYKLEWANQDGGIAASSATGYETGDRTSTWTITTTFTLGGGTINNIIDGTTTLSGNNNSFYFSNETASGKYIRFQLPAHKVYTNAKWYHTGSTTYGTWRYQGSNDGSTWTNIGSTFTLGGGTTTYHTELSGNTTPYLYYQLLGVSGSTSSAGNNLEIEFNMAAHSASGGRQVRVHATSLAWA